MPPLYLMEWALGRSNRKRDLNGLPNLNEDEYPPMPPVKPPKPDKTTQGFTCACGRKLIIEEF
ncbi:hypothetical protein LCGC14_0421320 [marine sediment metagenome]|uniref:Uncharacterized protein n=1 Tax=marine sediment metagenome TaxID=412755 RepID=A0A0F9SQU1_9ZZZZ